MAVPVLRPACEFSPSTAAAFRSKVDKSSAPNLKTNMDALRIEGLNLSLNGKWLLKNFSLSLPKGEIHVLMGRNGIGKSSLLKAIVGAPNYRPDGGKIFLNGQDILGKTADEIGRLGVFMAFQNPVELAGVSIVELLRSARQMRLPPGQLLDHSAFYRDLDRAMRRLNIDRSWQSKSVNDGFSGGEKKACELLQMLMLDPSLILLDEIDSGMDTDRIRRTGEILLEMRAKGRSILMVSHHPKLAREVQADRVHWMDRGAIVRSGDLTLADELDRKGFGMASDLETDH